MNETHTTSRFGKGVNDYLNASVTIADAKAAAFMAASTAVGAGVLQIQTADGVAPLLRALAIVMLVLALGINAAVLFPRLPSARRGLIFWEDIRTHTDAESYVRAVGQLTDDDVAVEYAAQNYFVSDVLCRKHWWIRAGVLAFVAGAALGTAAQLLK